MLVNMEDQFKGLPMADLIGGPLQAACEAQMRLAEATADFIRSVCFDIDPTGQRPPVMRVEFVRPEAHEPEYLHLPLEGLGNAELFDNIEKLKSAGI
ncbi:MAG: DUF2589 domain-containing protein [Chlorobium sp.]|uniref:DUF2589 domain-containing protein n=1 Tax=Chlorobium sp. TaxID=1095 RepID=UPI0025C4DA5A|nr:DUF2589 domain-containing protein [Chlorobium sp.]MCF8382043.1 DUF2589 domain-containing protein [Chlorobium sp.]